MSGEAADGSFCASAECSYQWSDMVFKVFGIDFSINRLVVDRLGLGTRNGVGTFHKMQPDPVLLISMEQIGATLPRTADNEVRFEFPKKQVSNRPAFA
jgi:hypothetical protein